MQQAKIRSTQDLLWTTLISPTLKTPSPDCLIDPHKFGSRTKCYERCVHFFSQRLWSWSYSSKLIFSWVSPGILVRKGNDFLKWLWIEMVSKAWAQLDEYMDANCVMGFEHEAHWRLFYGSQAFLIIHIEAAAEDHESEQQAKLLQMSRSLVEILTELRELEYGALSRSDW